MNATLPVQQRIEHCRREFKRGYFRSENEAIDLIGPLLRAEAVAVYHVLARNTYDDKVSMSAGEIARAAGCSRATVFRVLKELELIGTLSRNTSAGRENEYHLWSLKGRTITELRARMADGMSAPVSRGDVCGRSHRSQTESGGVSHRPGTRLSVKRVNKEDKTPDCKTALPPTPLSSEGGAAPVPFEPLSNPVGAGLETAWAKILADLKTQCASVSARTKLPDEYDELFRDTWQVGVRPPNVIVIGADDPIKAARALRKYRQRIEATAQKIFDFPVAFQIAGVVTEPNPDDVRRYS